MPEQKPAYELPVMKQHCKTCPFKPNKDGHWQNVKIANGVIERTLFQGHQLCHSSYKNDEYHNATNRCKGSYDHNLEIYRRMGLEHLVE